MVMNPMGSQSVTTITNLYNKSKLMIFCWVGPLDLECCVKIDALSTRWCPLPRKHGMVTMALNVDRRFND